MTMAAMRATATSSAAHITTRRTLSRSFSRRNPESTMIRSGLSQLSYGETEAPIFEMAEDEEEEDGDPEDSEWTSY